MKSGYIMAKSKTKIRKSKNENKSTKYVVFIWMLEPHCGISSTVAENAEPHFKTEGLASAGIKCPESTEY